MATSTEVMWRDRVSRWRRSGLTADALAAQEKEFQASTLRYWSSRLRKLPVATPTAALELLPVQLRPSRELQVRVGEDPLGAGAGRLRRVAGSSLRARATGGASVVIGASTGVAILRCSFDRLAAVVHEQIGRDPTSGAVFIFAGRRGRDG